MNDQLVGLEPPFFLVDLVRLTEKYRSFSDAFSGVFANFVVAASYKTAFLPAALAHLHRLGAWAEVVSELELDLAGRLSVPPQQTVYNGPGKSRDALRRALERGALVHLDSIEEVRAVAGIGPTAGTVGLRVNIALPDHTTRSRFGLPISDGTLAEAANVLRSAGIAVESVHAHLTSRRRALDYYRGVARELVEAIRVVGEEGLMYLDVGGGFGFAPPEMPWLSMPSFEDYAEVLREGLDEPLSNLDRLRVIAEPGIALFGDTATAYAPVLAVKNIGGRSVVVVDASVHTVKPTRHPQNLPTRVLAPDYSPSGGPDVLFDVVGYTCLEDDVIATDLSGPLPEVGDVLAIGNVGAYTWVFKPQFISRMPTFYTWDGKTVTLAREAEDFERFFGGVVFD